MGRDGNEVKGGRSSLEERSGSDKGRLESSEEDLKV